MTDSVFVRAHAVGDVDFIVDPGNGGIARIVDGSFARVPEDRVRRRAVYQRSRTVKRWTIDALRWIVGVDGEKFLRGLDRRGGDEIGSRETLNFRVDRRAEIGRRVVGGRADQK